MQKRMLEAKLQSMTCFLIFQFGIAGSPSKRFRLNPTVFPLSGVLWNERFEFTGLHVISLLQRPKVHEPRSIWMKCDSQYKVCFSETHNALSVLEMLLTGETSNILLSMPPAKEDAAAVGFLRFFFV